MLNNKENKAMENGYVVLPVEKYNKLMKAVYDAEQAAARFIRLTAPYDGQVTVDFDNEQFYTAAKKLYEASSFNTPERELIAPGTFNVWSSTLTQAVKTDEEA